MDNISSVAAITGIENNFTVHRPLEPGDVVELEIEGIGILRNRVV